MAGDTVLIERLLAGSAIALLMAGAGAALIASNALKRVIGLVLAGFGAIAVLALWVPLAVMAGAAIVFAQIAIGAAIVVRLQENYGSIETRELDTVDADSEPQGRRQ